MANAKLDPQTILAWAQLGKRLFDIGAATAEQLSWIIKLVHGPMKESDIQAVLKQIETQALSLAEKADADAGVQREGEGL